MTKPSLLLSALLLGAVLGCSAAERPLATRHPHDALAHGSPFQEPGLRSALNQLQPAEALAAEFVLQQHVTIQWSSPSGPGEAEFDAALERKGDSLLLLGLGPMQRVGFELELRRKKIRFKNHTGREVPFRPEDILADVQRVFYPWIDPKKNCRNCQRTGLWGSLEIEEQLGPEHLKQRLFQVRGRPELGNVMIQYSGQALLGALPNKAEVQNDWFGYQLTIESARMAP